MTGQEFRAAYPLIAGWSQKTLAEHAKAARPVAALGFSRLRDYYDKQILDSTKVVFVARVPVPPLAAMGLARFGELERVDLRGITYHDTYFIQAQYARNEALHFHELLPTGQAGRLGGSAGDSYGSPEARPPRNWIDVE